MTLKELSAQLIRDTDSQIADLRQKSAQASQQAAAWSEQANAMQADVDKWRAALEAANKRKKA